MKLAKRLLPLMMAVLLLASLLAACGGGNSDSGVANSEGTNTATSEPSGSTAEPDREGQQDAHRAGGGRQPRQYGGGGH